MKHTRLLASAAAVAIASVACAEFHFADTVQIYGSAWNGDTSGTTWGGSFDLGTSADFEDQVFGSPFFVLADSQVVSPNVVTFTFDYHLFAPADFNFHSITIAGLKNDLTIDDVAANFGDISTNGNDVFWSGTGAMLNGGNGGNYVLELTVYQAVPTPGALAVLGVAGLVGARRRRV
jgi:MYXO-CTERM domain-containing protein